ncbi:FdhF/YdeP family oxidoreductase [Catenovulum sp. 2E275]|uniref:FdhF/YdeP family oxidoreductase n=1 Tax=Catenovulum sp. 2E275 TaxID=2980497 RepID=UPI0021D37F73|nr:FdhF/YdeP family oxidoreductase [Catenovulum sp. 2E275]MCU4675993.1 FdhF/YdeP family oxidoreductase [Catenovulum sp. 2E275]
MSIHKQPEKAGGLASVQSTIKHLMQSHRTKDNIKNLLRVNQTDGFDCPGCAWGDNTHGAFQFCENGAKAIAWESTDKQLDSSFFKTHSVSQLLKQSDYWLEYQGRLTEPMRYNHQTDHYEPISWQGAFALIADKLKQLTDPNQLELYTSGRASNEAAFLYQLFGRLFGTNNFPDCSNMCHEASGVALTQAIGVGKGTVVLDDFEQADAIFVLGQNPGTNHPRMMNALRKAAKQGCKIVSFNNLKEVALKKFASPQSPTELLTPMATQISHLYLTPKLGGDMAALRGMAKWIFEQRSKQINRNFIQTHTHYFDDYQKVVTQTSWQKIEQQSGLTQAEIAQAATIFIESNKVISCWAMGLTQHKHSVDTINEVVNLHLLTGQIGKAGAGLCPVRGHSNVQGNRTVGINEKPSAEFIRALEKITLVKLPTAPGHNVYQALKALHQKNSKVLISLGGNLAQAAADTQFTHQAIKNAELNVQISTKLNRTHLLVSQDALILPCLGRTEKDNKVSGLQKITVEDTFSMVHASKGMTDPISANCLSETEIIAQIAHACLEQNINWLALKDDYSKIRDLMAKTLAGFADYNQKIEQPAGFHLTNSAAQLNWQTKTKRAEFGFNQLPEHILSDCYSEQINNKQVQFVLQSLRSHDQYNTTIYGMDDRYRGIQGERRVLFINQQDAEQLGLSQGDKVDIQSVCDQGILRQAHNFKIVYYDIPRGNLAAYYPETNPLLSIESIGEHSYTPTSKSIPVSLKQITDSLNINVIS